MASKKPSVFRNSGIGDSASLVEANQEPRGIDPDEFPRGS
jgi:hypothetical protein